MCFAHLHFLLCWHRPIFPGRFQPSIFGTGELNFCVRNGNRWTLTAIGTNFTATAFSRRYIKQVSLIYSNIFIFQLIGDPYEIRTRVAGVRGRSLRPLDQRATICTLWCIKMVHHQGLEPGTPWLRVRCSTNWANGASFIFVPWKLNKVKETCLRREVKTIILG